jgi:hypothetical protein
MKNPNEPQHKTRDHRFAYISGGDITGWARGTTKFQYPEPKGRTTKLATITSKNACVMKTVEKTKASRQQVLIQDVPHGMAMGVELEGTGRQADAIDNALAISDMCNRRLGLFA